MKVDALQNVETPVPVFKTYIGNLLYSTLDFTEELCATTPAIFGQIDIQNIFSRDFDTIPIGRIQLQQIEDCQGSMRVNILSSRQKGQLGSNPSGLSVDTSGGRKVLTVADYAKRISADGFSVVIALADEIPLFSGSKSSFKATARSLLWLKQLKENNSLNWEDIYLFGVTGALSHENHSLTATASPIEIDKKLFANATELLNLGCSGLVVGGAGMGESLYQLEVAIRTVKHAATSSGVVEVPDISGENSRLNCHRRVMVMAQEMDTIREILLAARSGGDFIGTNLPHIISTAGLALTWDLKRRSTGGSRTSSFDAAKRKLSSEAESEGIENDLENSAKKQNVGEAPAASTNPQTASSCTAINTTASAGVSGQKVDSKSSPVHETPDDFMNARSAGGVINLWETIHCKTLRPILECCDCHACKHHTRAYIHHLLLAKEMLGDILVYCHNQHQIVQLFNEIRCLKKTDMSDPKGGRALEEWSASLVAVMH
jgi:Queuine tRNA-ribosyltransferase